MDFMSQFDRPVMAGSSVHFDRAFLREHLPLVESQFHYRNLDVSSIRTFMEACGFSSAPFPLAGKMKHRALPDIINSIDMYASYVKLVTSLANAPTVSP
jgi:oligoribonuclease